MNENELNGMTMEAVVQELGVTPRTLRYYEEVGLIPPPARTRGGHRLYNETAVERLKQILRLKDHLGVSLQEIREILEAEQSLEDLRKTFRENKRNSVDQTSVVDRYISVLRDLIETMDRKIESVSTMRSMYQERLDRSIQFLENHGGPGSKGEGE